MNFRALAVLAATWLAAAVGPATAQSQINETERATVRVAVIAESPYGRTLYGTGSGFLVAPNLVVTNAHVVAAARQQPAFGVAIVEPEGDGLVIARIIQYSALADLALLEFRSGSDSPPVTISIQEPHAGDAIIALGFPDIDDLQRPAEELVRPVPPSRSTGSIASLRDRAPTGDPIPTINHEAAISSGSSGGPLLDECGRVIGVNTWHTRGADTGEGRGVATRASQLIDFLEQAGVTPMITDERCLNFAERVAAERAATVEALEAQNRELAAKLETADRLTRIAVVILIGGTLALFVAVAVLGALLISRRHPHPAPHEEHHAEVDAAPRRNVRGVAAVIGAATVAAIIVTAVGIAFLRARGPDAASPANVEFAGKMSCAFDARASRSAGEVSDTSFTVTGEMCVNGRTLYARTADGSAYQRALLLSESRALDVLTIVPGTGEFRRERYPLGADAYQRALTAAGPLSAEGCVSDEARAAVERRNETLLPFAAGEASQRIVWACTPQQSHSE